MSAFSFTLVDSSSARSLLWLRWIFKNNKNFMWILNAYADWCFVVEENSEIISFYLMIVRKQYDDILFWKIFVGALFISAYLVMKDCQNEKWKKWQKNKMQTVERISLDYQKTFVSSTEAKWPVRSLLFQRLHFEFLKLSVSHSSLKGRY